MIVFSLSIFIYASDEESEEVFPLAPALDDQDLYSYAVNLVNDLQSSDPVRAAAAEKTLTDIWNILNTINTNYVNINFATIAPTVQQIATDVNTGIHDYLYDIAMELTGVSSGVVYGDNIFVNLKHIMNTVDSLSGSVGYTNTYLSNIQSYLNSIDGKTVNYSSVLSSIESKTKDYTTYFNTQISRLDDLEILNWLPSGVTFQTLWNENNNIDLSSGNYDNTQGYYRAIFTSNTYVSNLRGSFVDFQIPVAIGNVNGKIEFYRLRLNEILTPINYEFVYQYSDNRSTHFIINIIDFPTTTRGFVIDFKIPQGNFYYNTAYIATDSSVRYIDFDNSDYHILYNTIVNSKIEKNTQGIKDLSSIYASPEELAARQASKEVIDETLDDFTGSGSAAAKKSDVSSAKDISNSLRSGLNSGGSMSDALSVLSPASGFWGWFSQDNASYFTYIYNDPATDSHNDIYIDYYIPALFINGVQYDLIVDYDQYRLELNSYRLYVNYKNSRLYLDNILLLDIPNYQAINDSIYFNAVGGNND